MKLYYADPQPGATGYGWATCNRELKKALGQMCELVTPNDEGDATFIPMKDHDFNPCSHWRGRVNLAYSFFESELGPKAAKNAAQFDTVFVGSTWCKERCAERGIHNTEVLIQGVDREIFRPDRFKFYSRNEGIRDGQFRIFSGGKFEYRKGQDLVIAAFREFSRAHPEAHLVCSWFNPWPAIFISFAESLGLKMADWQSRTQEQCLSVLLETSGLKPCQFTILPRLSQQDLAREMANTDCGLFPNRCEGGTNLVLMEYAACGRPVIANAETGHRDVIDLIDGITEAQINDVGWAETDIEDMVSLLRGGKIIVSKSIPTWEAAAKQVLQRAEQLLQAKSHDSTVV